MQEVLHKHGLTVTKQHQREFIEIVENSKTAEISVYTFKGQKSKVMQLALMFNEALQSANAIISRNGY